MKKFIIAGRIPPPPTSPVAGANRLTLDFFNTGGCLDTSSNDKETAIFQKRSLPLDKRSQDVTILDRNHNEKTDTKTECPTLRSISCQNTCFQTRTARKRELKEETGQLVSEEKTSESRGIQ